MHILIIFGIWFVSWMSIIFIRMISIIFKNNDIKNNFFDSEYYQFCDEEIIKDGNNLFSTGLTYFALITACLLIKNIIINWIIFILGIAFCIIPLISSLGMIIQMTVYKNKYTSLMTLAGLINSFAPFVMIINFYFWFSG